MKTENLPIKLECFSVSFNGARQLIGFVMIPIRGVSIISGTKPVKVIHAYKSNNKLNTDT